MRRSDHLRRASLSPAIRDRYQSLFEPGATGALFSCLTGRPFGIGDAVADFLGIQLTAPTEEVSCNSLGGSRQQEGFDVAIKYQPDSSRICGSAGRPYSRG